MQFFQWIWWGSLSQQSRQSQPLESRRRASASNVRTTPKHDGKIEPVLTALETRELIGSFVADIALAARGVAVAERASDLFGDPSLVDFSVSGGSSSGTSPTVIDRGGWQGAVPPMSVLGGSPPGGGEVGLGESLLGKPDASPTQSPPTANDISDTTAPVLGDALADAMPQTHGAIRKLQLAPPASAVGACHTSRNLCLRIA